MTVQDFPSAPMPAPEAAARKSSASVVEAGSAKKIAHLDGLRGVAALIVVVSHATLSFYPTLHTGGAIDSDPYWVYWLAQSPITVFFRGTAAVFIFFVLSGYVLSWGLLRADVNPVSVARAVAKRYLRLGGPAGVSALMGVALFGVPLSTGLREALFGTLLLGETKANYVLWTMSVEFYGSLLVFALVAFFGFRPRLLFAAALLVAGYFAVQEESSMYYFLFAAGCALSTLPALSPSTALNKNLVGALLFVLGCYLASYQSNIDAFAPLVRAALYLQGNGVWFYWPAFIPSIGAILIVVGALTCAPLITLLGGRTGRWIGAVSFGVYLIHPFVLHLLDPYADGNFAVWLACVIAATLAAAHLFMLMVDRPFTRLANRFACSIVPGSR